MLRPAELNALDAKGLLDQLHRAELMNQAVAEYRRTVWNLYQQRV